MCALSGGAIYHGWVRHRRYEPRSHDFRYRMFQVLLDLSELDEVFGRSLLWSARRPALAWFRRRDHFGDPAVLLETCVRDLVESRTGRRPMGRIRLLTHLRYFGICMNPVSFYYIDDEEGTRVETIVAEVHNTPWGERHCYVLDRDGSGSREVHRFRKDFHVSPFMSMEQSYVWRLSDPEDRLVVHMENHEDDRRVFDATLSMERRPMTSWTRTAALVRFPCMTLRVLLAIYWQALRLRLKKVSFHPHPRHRTDAKESQHA